MKQLRNGTSSGECLQQAKNDQILVRMEGGRVENILSNLHGEIAMWVLIVFQLMSGSATAKNSLPINYSGVVMQEFSSKESCERAAKVIDDLKTKVGQGAMAFRNGIISTQCVQK